MGSLREAIDQVDSLLKRSLKYYPRDLPPNHYARLTNWTPPSERPKAEGELALLLERHAELARAQAEALLVEEQLKNLILSPQERERLTQRAVGIVPSTEVARFREFLSCPEFNPRKLARSAAGLLDAVRAVSGRCCPATGVAFGMFLLGGLKTTEQLVRGAEQLDRLFVNLTQTPILVQALEAAYQPGRPAAAGFQALFRVLQAVRDRLWTAKPERVSDQFLLPKVIDGYLGRPAGVGNSLGLGVLDAAVVGKLGFEVRFRLESTVISLEVLVQSRSVFWEVIRPSPLTFVPISAGREVNLEDLFSLTYRSLAALSFAQGRIDRSIEFYGRALELVPDSTETLNNLGTCYLRKGMPDLAVKVSSRAIELAPDGYEAHQNLGNAYSMMESWPRAIDAFKQAIRVRPRCTEAYNNLGLALYRAGHSEQAIAALEAAIENEPGYAPAHFNLGNVHLDRKHIRKAVRAYRQAVRLEPGMVQAHYNLGQAHYALGELDAAINCYRKAVTINPRHFGAWHNLGIAYRDKGMKEKAVEAIEKAITINPNLMR